jgi:hypothetical protein
MGIYKNIYNERKKRNNSIWIEGATKDIFITMTNMRKKQEQPTMTNQDFTNI